MFLSLRNSTGARKTVSATRRTRRCRIEVGVLEGRLMLAGDVTAPVTTLQVVPNSLNGTGYYTTSPEVVNLVASEAGSPNGLTTYYNVDNAGFVAGNTFPLVDGLHTVQFYSVDQSGNREATQTQTIKIDSTPPIVTVSANPSTLWPPNNKLVTVTVSGQVSDVSGGIPGMVNYRVVDEYGQVQPSGTAMVGPDGHYSFQVQLQSSRQGGDRDGRQYAIAVAAFDEAGNVGSASTLVVVPHDQGNHGGNGQGGGNGHHRHRHHGHVDHNNNNQGDNSQGDGGDEGQS